MSVASPNQIDRLTLTALAKHRARELGFDLVGIARAERSPRADHLRRWLDAERGGTMDYLARRFEERADPSVYLPGALSVICVAMNYHVPLEPIAPDDRRTLGKVARYALGDDYHEVIKSRLFTLADWVRQNVPDARTRAAVDTAPVLERDLAARSGIGWIGKNTCLIHPQMGSWLLLGEVVTTADLAPDEPEADHCGTCTRCIEACPTGAITAPYELDARRCISYLTIEHRDEIPPELQSSVGDWLYGCDICQDVCPHNTKAPHATDPAMKPRFPQGVLDVDEVLNWTADDYRTRLRGSAMKRVKLPVLQRNARLVASNIGSDNFSGVNSKEGAPRGSED